MQVANALNNIIRILFNPKIEAFKLFDFLIVKSCENRYLAQIVEIYDDKFDASQNVAKLKIFYKISENNEVMPYDNFTPNKECEIIKIKQEEVENFINMDKETLIFATNAKSSTALSIQYDFFNKNPLVLADKIENASAISLNIAKKISEKRPVVLIDSTGILEHDCAKKITASKDIKIPLNFSTIDYVFDRCLRNATLEFQAAAGSIICEIKKFAKKQPSEFIPFNAFLRVILEQYKVTPYPELKLLLVKMKKFQMEEVFARYKKDVENLHKTVEKNAITIIDVSNLDSYWQKVYFEYISDSFEKEIYLITRINDENCDVDLINKIYNKKKNINFIPTVSYNYKKLPTLLQYSKNYILLPSLNQRPDFLDANFALANLLSNECIIFGENTDNFLHLAKDYELLEQEKRKNYKKIALTFVQSEEEAVAIKQNLGENGDYFENKQKTDSERLMSELANLEEENQKKLQEESSQEEFTEIENPEPNKETSSYNVEEELVLQETQQEEAPESDSFEELEAEDDLNLENLAEETEEETEQETEETNSDDDELDFAELVQETNTDEAEATETEVTTENEAEEETEQEDDGFVFVEDNETLNISDEENITINDEEKTEEDNNLSFSDEELDFFQIAKESQAQETQESKEENSSEDTLDLSQVSNESLDSSFENIINSKDEVSAPSIAIDTETKIDESLLTKDEPKENLPIFKDDTENNEETHIYSVGEVISHNKYGRGTVVKIIKYEERQLLQIEFDESGKKLLDPKVANLKLEQ